MEQNSTREKLAWLSVLAVIVMISFGLVHVANETTQWLAADSSDEATTQMAMQRPEPARNNVTLPADIQQQKQQMQNTNPGGWASGQFDLQFTPGPAMKKSYDRQMAPQTPQSRPVQPQVTPHKDKQDKPQYRPVEPDETMEEFWKPDYYDEGLDL